MRRYARTGVRRRAALRAHREGVRWPRLETRDCAGTDGGAWPLALTLRVAKIAKGAKTAKHSIRLNSKKGTRTRQRIWKFALALCARSAARLLSLCARAAARLLALGARAAPHGCSLTVRA